MAPAFPPARGVARRILKLGLVVLGLGVTLTYAHSEVEKERLYRESVQDVPVMPPMSVPTPSQESIDLAMEMYGIEVPHSAEYPRFDPNLDDRGLTSRATFADRAVVTIGPAAFSSWALLGSTLAHEIEVHCNQSFLAIWVMDLLRLDGVKAAEREAYAHEIAGAERFGLTSSDVQLIEETVNFYYPEEVLRQREFPVTFRSWMATNFLSGKSHSAQ